MIKIKQLLKQGYSRSQLEEILNNIKNNIDINEYLYNFDLPPGIYRRALQKCNDINIKNEYDSTPLHYACLRDNIQIVKLLLQHPKINVNIQDKWGDTPLHLTCLGNNIQIAKLLLQRPQIDINVKDVNDFTPLSYAYNRNFTQIIKLFFKEYKN